jgi:hypothetical protein
MKMETEFSRHSASFRDADAFVFTNTDGHTYRQLNLSYKEHYDHLMNSGLYANLSRSGKLLPHTEADTMVFDRQQHYKTLLPEQLAFITYPYEWCFDQWKDAAMLTLEVLQESLRFGMILKDATPFNIQFHRGKYVFIDTASFERYEAGKPWVAYRQFCECFFGPLLLMHYGHAELNRMLTGYPEGIPLSIVSRLLPFRSKLNAAALLHIHFQDAYKPKQPGKQATIHLSQNRLLAIIDSLYSAIAKLKPTAGGSSAWSRYYPETILSTEYLSEKHAAVDRMIAGLSIRSALDAGANNGYFSELLASRGITVVAVDADGACVNALYRNIREKQLTTIYPLQVDMAAPTPAIGWNNTEHESFLNRCQNRFDLTLALALVHHLAIGKNIPLEKIASVFASFGEHLLIEFIPKSDPKVQQLLENRKDIFSAYSQEGFEQAFLNYFSITDKVRLTTADRVLYLLKRNT